MLPELKTERLSIRMLTRDDLRACYELNAEIGWLDATASEEHNLEQRQLWLDWTIRNYRELAALNQPPYGERAIVEQQTGRLVGMVGLVPLLAPFGRLPSFGGNPSARFTAEVGLFWALRPAAQGQGFATEAARALIHFAFDSMQLERILAKTDYDNARSAAVMQRLGMRIERNPSPDPPWFQITGSLSRPPDPPHR
jgi:RimJ/RimL family protein N-acetyltransferase